MFFLNEISVFFVTLNFKTISAATFTAFRLKKDKNRLRSRGRFLPLYFVFYFVNENFESPKKIYEMPNLTKHCSGAICCLSTSSRPLSLLTRFFAVQEERLLVAPSWPHAAFIRSEMHNVIILIQNNSKMKS